MSKSKAIEEYKGMPLPVVQFLEGKDANTRRSYLSAFKKFVTRSLFEIDREMKVTKGGDETWFDLLTEEIEGKRSLKVVGIKDEGKQVYPYWLRAYPWKGLTAKRVMAVLDTMRTAKRKKISAQAYNQYLAAIKGLMKLIRLDMSADDYQTAQDYMRLSQIAEIGGKRTRKKNKRLVEGDEITAMIEACKADETLAGVRDAAILAIGYSVGPRVDSISKLDLDDYNPKTHDLLLREAKGNKDLEAAVIDDVVPFLDRWIEARGSDPGPMFTRIDKWGNQKIARLSTTSIQAILKRRAKQAGIEIKKHGKDLSFHALRRSAGTNITEVKGIRIAQLNLGHENISTTAKSYDLSAERQARDAIRQMKMPFHA